MQYLDTFNIDNGSITDNFYLIQSEKILKHVFDIEDINVSHLEYQNQYNQYKIIILRQWNIFVIEQNISNYFELSEISQKYFNNFITKNINTIIKLLYNYCTLRNKKICDIYIQNVNNVNDIYVSLLTSNVKFMTIVTLIISQNITNLNIVEYEIFKASCYKIISNNFNNKKNLFSKVECLSEHIQYFHEKKFLIKDATKNLLNILYEQDSELVNENSFISMQRVLSN